MFQYHTKKVTALYHTCFLTPVQEDLMQQTMAMTAYSNSSFFEIVRGNARDERNINLYS